jgi:uncharacterized membrane protein YccC
MPQFRLPDFTRLFVGQHIVNGVSVGAGVMAIALCASAIFGFAEGQIATLGAIAASISDLPSPWREKARTLAYGFTLALVSTTLILLARPWAPAALLTVGVVSFAAGMISGLGRWAIALGMQAVIPLVFVLGYPPTSFTAGVEIQALFVLGGLTYIAFALVATVITDRSGRRLVASTTIRELSIYLRTVAGVFDPKTEFERAYGGAIREQAALAEQIQAARALLLDHARPGTENRQLAATIGILLDAFDALIAAQCDIVKVRSARSSDRLLEHIGAALREGSLDLEHLSLEMLATDRPTLPADHQVAIDALKREAEQLDTADAPDPEAREALQAATRRLIMALGHIRRLEQALSDVAAAEATMEGVNLVAFLPQRSFALGQLKQHFTIASPVFRYSVRFALAMMAGQIIAQFLGDAGHGNWVLLTIAVVMRSNYGWTKSRRDDRVIGTLVGCVIAAGAVAWLPMRTLVLVQGLAVTVTQSFVRLNYRAASAGASVMALVSLHLVQPSFHGPVLARLADTLIGAALAHLFSYVWPHWEFSDAPNIARRLLARLGVFSNAALDIDVPPQDYRLARKDVIEAIAALSDSAGRMSVEPAPARKGLDEMAALLMAAHGFIAELSAARLDIRAGALEPDPRMRAWLQARFAPKDGAPPLEPPPVGRIAAAALAVVDAAEGYQKAAKSELSGS